MQASAPVVCSKPTPFTFTLSPSSHFSSVRPFNKHLQCKQISVKNSLTVNSSKLHSRNYLEGSTSFVPNGEIPFKSQSNFSLLPISKSRIIRPNLLKCSYFSSNVPTSSEFDNPLSKTLKDFSFESLKKTLLQLTPFRICKWVFVCSIAIAASKWSLDLLVSPFFWMYFSWTWLFWPWMVAIALAVYGVYCFNRHLKGESTLFEQFSIVTSAFTWLTLVPPAHFNGFLEGWPFVFFFVYHYFFFLNISVRKRMYGDYYTREHDAKWDVSLPNWNKLLFCAGVMVAHWAAAFEGTELHLIPGGWNNVGIWGLIMLTVFMQYHSTLYLAKYSEKVVVPTAVVQFGPYRFVRHPIYASTMLLFVTYFTALRAPVSALFVVAVCLMYYGQKAKLEEALMLDTFEERYKEYVDRVKYKLIPFVY